MPRGDQAALDTAGRKRVADERAYEVRRSVRRRRTVAIQVRPDGSVRVLAPARLSDRQIATFVAARKEWIEARLASFQENGHETAPRRYLTGEPIVYLGRPRRLQVVAGGEAVQLSAGCLQVSVDPDLTGAGYVEAVRTQLRGWYVARAGAVLSAKTRRYARLLDCEPARVIVKEYRSRWGCCYADGRLSFNWRLIMAPHPVIDYVVVHELAHLKHHNHSKDFWGCVAAVFPHYREQRRWLRDHGGGLLL